MHSTRECLAFSFIARCLCGPPSVFRYRPIYAVKRWCPLLMTDGDERPVCYFVTVNGGIYTKIVTTPRNRHATLATFCHFTWLLAYCTVIFAATTVVACQKSTTTDRVSKSWRR